MSNTISSSPSSSSSATSNIASSIFNSVTSSVSNLWNTEKDSSVLAQNKEILKIGNMLNSLFIDRTNIEIPRLVVVGSQSSGKSSLLNSILGMDILPTGSNMVTRSPLQLELIQTGTPDQHTAVFGIYREGEWMTDKSISISYPNITPEQKLEISNQIELITRANAGDEMNITVKPIYLRIISPNVPNLSLVDLPGLTMVACTDKGQPKDIKDQIKKMVGGYIKPKKTIILAVMPARTDIEADIALDLIKEYDPKGERTIGILTKLDLMNDGTSVARLLENNVSIDLQLKYGYYGIKNRSKRESVEKNVQEGMEIEAKYFKKHPVYSNSKYATNLGIPSLCVNLSQILIEQIKSCLPKILGEINQNIVSNDLKLEKLGQPLPKDEQSKSSYIYHLLSRFSRKFISVLEDRGNIINSGRNIKDIFIDYRKSVGKINPFDHENCSDQYIEESLKNCEGNHMSFPSPPIEVMEQIMKDTHKKPIHKLFEPSKICANRIMSELVSLTSILVDDIGIIRFPHFTKIIKTEIINHILIDNFNVCIEKINENIKMQENYLWTDNEVFLRTLENCENLDTKKSQIGLMRSLLQNYYQTVVLTLQDVIPKCIMMFIVKETEDSMSSKLYDKIKTEKLDDLVREYDEIHQERLVLEKSTRELYNAKKMIEEIV